MDTVTRRKFLIASGVVGAGALAAGAGAVTWNELHHAAQASPLEPGQGILVLLTLYGGNDGLNTVIPAADPVYQSSRPGWRTPNPRCSTSARPRLQPGDDRDAPALAGQEAGHRARRRVSDARTTATSSRWTSGRPRRRPRPQTSGWLGRWLDTQPDDELRALRAVSRSAARCRRCSRAPRRPDPRCRSASSGCRRAWTGYGSARARQQFERGLPVRRVRGQGHRRPVHRRKGLQPVLPRIRRARRDGRSALAQQLDIVASCIESSVPTQVYAVSLGGFDTHSAEKGTQSTSARRGRARRSPASSNESPRETGRQGRGACSTPSSGGGCTANANEGTDHGTAGRSSSSGTR